MTLIELLKIEFYKSNKIKHIIVSILFPLVYWVVLNLLIYKFGETFLASFPSKDIFTAYTLNFIFYYYFFNLLVILYQISDMIRIENSNNIKKQLVIFGVDLDNLILSKLIIISSYLFINVLIFILSFEITRSFIVDENLASSFTFIKYNYFDIFIVSLSYPILFIPYIYLLLNILFKFNVKSYFLSVILPIIVQMLTPLLFLIEDFTLYNYLPNLLGYQYLYEIDHPYNIKMFSYHFVSIGYFLVIYFAFNYKKYIKS